MVEILNGRRTPPEAEWVTAVFGDPFVLGEPELPPTELPVSGPAIRAARAVQPRDEHGEFASFDTEPNRGDRRDFAAKYADWAGTLTEPERTACANYFYSAMKLNDGLRQGLGQAADRGISIPALDAALERARIPADMTVLRAAPSSAFPADIVGSTITDKAYMSTAIDTGWFQDFAEDVGIHADVTGDAAARAPAQLIISLHAGQPGASIDAAVAGHADFDSEDPAGEMTLPRDARFRVTSDQIEPSPITDPSMNPNIRTIRLDYLGVGPHA